MDFSQFTAGKTANTRSAGSAKVQAFKGIKLRRTEAKKDKKISSRFIVATELWRALKLDSSEFGLRHFVAKDKKSVLLGLVSKDDAKILKGTESGTKGKVFTSDVVEQTLVAQGVLEANKMGNQFITVTKVGENVTIDGVSVMQVFALSKDTTVVDDGSSDADDDAAASEAAQEEAAAPAPSAAKWD